MANITIDGLLVAAWPEAFRAMREAELTAANCTCCVWEDFGDTMRRIAAFKQWIRDSDETIIQIYGVADIHSAAEARRSGIILGFQNTSGLDGRLSNVQLFHELGVRIIQLTYNYQNDVGGGCYEPRDGGLTEFGRLLIGELNRLGILVDLSHVGELTSREALAASTAPVAITHAAPSALHPHPRNKSDALIRAVAEAGGVIGLTPLSWFLARGEESTLDDYLAAIEHIIDLAGEEHVAIGSDITEGRDEEDMVSSFRHRGDGPPVVEPPKGATGFPMPPGMQRVIDLKSLPDAMAARGWSDDRVDRIMGGNWLRLFDEVWK